MAGQENHYIKDEEDRRGRKRKVGREIIMSIANSVTGAASISAMMATREITEKCEEGRGTGKI